MAMNAVIVELRRQRDLLSSAIATLERLNDVVVPGETQAETMTRLEIRVPPQVAPLLTEEPVRKRPGPKPDPHRVPVLPASFVEQVRKALAKGPLPSRELAKKVKGWNRYWVKKLTAAGIITSEGATAKRRISLVPSKGDDVEVVWNGSQKRSLVGIGSDPAWQSPEGGIE